MPIKIGIKPGQKRETSAICVAEASNPGREYEAPEFRIRHLERLPMGTKYSEMAERLGEIVSRVRERDDGHIQIFVDLTGLGAPILDLLRRGVGRVERCSFTGTYVCQGEKRNLEGNVIRLGKAYLVTRLVALLQDGRLHLPRNPETELLAQELLDYEIKAANEVQVEPFRVGAHDDQVTALGLAVQADQGQSYVVPMLV